MISYRLLDGRYIARIERNRDLDRARRSTPSASANGVKMRPHIPCIDS